MSYLFRNARCYICNRVSHAEISSDYGEFSSERFTDDGTGFVCHDCNKFHDEIMSDFSMEDDLDPEEDPYDYDE